MTCLNTRTTHEPNAASLCKSVVRRGKYKYKKLQMMQHRGEINVGDGKDDHRAVAYDFPR